MTEIDLLRAHNLTPYTPMPDPRERFPPDAARAGVSRTSRERPHPPDRSDFLDTPMEPIRPRPPADLRTPTNLSDAMPAPAPVDLVPIEEARANIYGGIIATVVFFLNANRERVIDLAVRRVRLLPDAIERMLFGGFFDAVVWAIAQLQDEPEPIEGLAAEFDG